MEYTESGVYVCSLCVVFIKATTGAIGIAMYAYYSDCDPVLAGVRTSEVQSMNDPQ